MGKKATSAILYDSGAKVKIVQGVSPAGDIEYGLTVTYDGSASSYVRIPSLRKALKLAAKCLKKVEKGK